MGRQNGVTPLGSAAKYGEVEVLKRLIAARCDVNTRTIEVRNRAACNGFHESRTRPDHPFLCRSPRILSDFRGSPEGWCKAMKKQRHDGGRET
eukprot:3909514-Rhodomonas_salina.1